MTPESKPQGSEQPGRPHPSRNFEEDFQHENGNYLNVCSDCGKQFLGYKRRVTCKLCSLPNPSADEEVERLTEPKSEDVRKWLEFYWQEGFRLGTTNEGAKSTVVALLRELIALSAKHKEEREQWDRTRRIIDAEVEKAKASYEKELSQLRASLAEKERENTQLKRENENTWRAHGQIVSQLSALQSELATAQRKIERLIEELDWQNKRNSGHPTRGGFEFYINEEWMGLASAAMDGDYGWHASLAKKRFDPDDERVRVRRVIEDDALLKELQTAMEERDNLKTQLTVAQAEIKRQKELLTFPGIYER